MEITDQMEVVRAHPVAVMMVRGRIVMEGRAMRLYGWKDPAHSLIEALNPESRRCLPRTKKARRVVKGWC